ncbi:MAG: glycosyltransferase family 2 protein [Solirubrobacterales bacterium]
MTAAPRASVFVLTHDHVEWIGQALDSALAQEAPFEYELLVADDFSTDGTREKVLEYATHHPDRIRTFLPDRNLGIAGIWLRAARQCRGEYVAILEGDDFWTSPDKLAKQVQLLDRNPGWSTCFHRATLFFDDGSRPSRPATPGFAKEVFDLDDILRSCFIPFLTVAFRRDVLASVPEWLFEYRWFDWLFHIWCAQQGSIGFLDEDMASYRVHGAGNWSARSRIDQLEEDLRVYERLAGELPERRALIDRCVDSRRCQLAVEEAGVAATTPVVQVDPGEGGEQATDPYFNGRPALVVSMADPDPGAGIASLVSAPPPGEGQLHYPVPGVQPRPAQPGACALVAPRSLDLGAPGIAALLAGKEPFWSDDWSRIWELDVDSPASDRQEEAAVEMGALVEIGEVSLVEPTPEGLLGRFLDEPRPGAVLDAKAVDVIGWALGSEREAVAVEFSYDGKPFWRASLRSERPDLAETFPQRGEAGRAGFRTTLNLLGTGAEFEVEAAAVLKGQRRVPIGTIRGRHKWRRDHTPAFAELVSVVIPCYQQAQYLGEAIESVLAQTYPHLEVVVVDDGSTDNVGAIASRYPGVRCIREPNSGPAAARNAGIRNSNGDFLVFLDADDRLLPQGVQAGVQALEARQECAAAIGTYRRTSFDNRAIDTHEQPTVNERQYEQMMEDNWAGFPARAIYRRSLLEHVRGFDSEIDAAADFGFNLAVAREFPIASHETMVAEHREHGRNLSADASVMLTETLAAMRKQRPHLKGDRDRKRAYKQGMRNWKRYWGDLLAVQAREAWREGERGEAFRGALKLLRHRPGALPRLLGSDSTATA